MVGWKRSWTAKMAIVRSGLKSDRTYLGQGWKEDERRKGKKWIWIKTGFTEGLV